jgi:hypothetical protein
MRLVVLSALLVVSGEEKHSSQSRRHTLSRQKRKAHQDWQYEVTQEFANLPNCRIKTRKQMIVYLSESRLSSLIRQAEGIDAPDSEIALMMDKHARGIFSHVANYGVRMVGMISHTGDIARFKMEIGGNDRETIIAGLQWLNPVCISLEQEDLPALCPNPLGLGVLQSTWHDVHGEFDRIQPATIIDTMENVATRLAFSLDTQAHAEIAKTIDPAGYEQGFEEWCQQNGIRNPTAHHDEVERHRQAEITERQQQEQARLDEWRSRGAESSSWDIREI